MERFCYTYLDNYTKIYKQRMRILLDITSTNPVGGYWYKHVYVLDGKKKRDVLFFFLLE